MRDRASACHQKSSSRIRSSSAAKPSYSGVMLVAVVKENGGRVVTLVLYGEVDEAHDLREVEAV